MRLRHILPLVVLLSCGGQSDCPDGYLRDNDGNCLQVESDGSTDDGTGDSETGDDGSGDGDGTEDDCPPDDRFEDNDGYYYDTSTGLSWSDP